MKKKIDRKVATKIRKLAKDLAEFRASEGKQKAHPSENIWDRAVELCETAPIAVVASGIVVSPQGLRNRIKAKKEQKVSGGFMEIPVGAVGSTGANSQSGPVFPGMIFGPTPAIELERRDGLKLRINHLPNEISLKSLLSQFAGGSL